MSLTSINIFIIPGRRSWAKVHGSNDLVDIASLLGP